jgi:hypothetical protein
MVKQIAEKTIKVAEGRAQLIFARAIRTLPLKPYEASITMYSKGVAEPLSDDDAAHKRYLKRCKMRKVIPYMAMHYTFMRAGLFFPTEINRDLGRTESYTEEVDAILDGIRAGHAFHLHQFYMSRQHEPAAFEAFKELGGTLDKLVAGGFNFLVGDISLDCQCSHGSYYDHIGLTFCAETPELKLQLYDSSQGRHTQAGRAKIVKWFEALPK